VPEGANLGPSLFERNVPIEQVEHAVLLGCARKYVTLINRHRSGPIISFSYFENGIDGVRQLKMPTEYRCHLQMRVARLEQQWEHMKAAAAPKCAPS
jgi:hypothetical protein